jgi:hypothetical protein
MYNDILDIYTAPLVMVEMKVWSDYLSKILVPNHRTTISYTRRQQENHEYYLIVFFEIYFQCYEQPARSQDSVVGIATSYELDDRGVGVRVPVVSKIFSSPDRPYRL